MVALGLSAFAEVIAAEFRVVLGGAGGGGAQGFDAAFTRSVTTSRFCPVTDRPRRSAKSGGRIRSSADAALRKTLQGRMQPFRASNFPHDSAERFEC